MGFGGAWWSGFTAFLRSAAFNRARGFGLALRRFCLGEVTVKRSDHFLAALADYERIVILSHDNPDPDAIASGWALYDLIERKLKRRPRLVAGGALVRAENIRLVELLAPPLELVDHLEVEAGSGGVYVDCHPESVSHLLEADGLEPVAVLDHHVYAGRRRPKVPFKDLRPKVAAAATIATFYLKEQKLEPSADLATALIYAMRSDTRSAQAQLSRADKRAFSWLTPLCDLQKLTDIENAPLPKSYFEDLLLALENTFQYGDTALCFMPKVHHAGIVGEVADMLIRCDEIRRVFCGAQQGQDILISVRTTSDGGDASLLTRKTLAGIGYGGGHEHRAGGKICGRSDNGQIPADLQTELRGRWLEACKVEQGRGTRLVPPKEIMNHL